MTIDETLLNMASLMPPVQTNLISATHSHEKQNTIHVIIGLNVVHLRVHCQHIVIIALWRVMTIFPDNIKLNNQCLARLGSWSPRTRVKSTRLPLLRLHLVQPHLLGWQQCQRQKDLKQCRNARILSARWEQKARLRGRTSSWPGCPALGSSGSLWRWLKVESKRAEGSDTNS